MTAEQATLFDPDFLAASTGIREAAFLSGIYAQYLDSLRELLQVLREPHSLDRRRQLAHKLKSSSGAVGAHSLARALRDLEGHLRAGSGVQAQLELIEQLCLQTIDAIDGVVQAA